MNIGTNSELAVSDVVSVGYSGARETDVTVTSTTLTVSASTFLELVDFSVAITDDAAELQSSAIKSVTVSISADNSGDYPFVDVLKKEFDQDFVNKSLYFKIKDRVILPAGCQVKFSFVLTRSATYESETANVTYKAKLKYVEFVNAA